MQHALWHWHSPWLLIAVAWGAIGLFLAAYGDPPDPPGSL